MKKVTTTREEKIIINETKYQAFDGTMFNDEQDCLIYEEKIYLNELKIKYSKIPQRAVLEQDFLKLGGSEEYVFNIVKVRNDDDIVTILKLYIHFNKKHFVKKSEHIFKEQIEKNLEILKKSKGRDIIIGRGNSYNYDINVIDEESFCIFYPLDELTEHIKSFGV